MSVYMLTDAQLFQKTASMCERRMFVLRRLLQLWAVFMSEGTLAEED